MWGAIHEGVRVCGGLYTRGYECGGGLYTRGYECVRGAIHEGVRVCGGLYTRGYVCGGAIALTLSTLTVAAVSDARLTSFLYRCNGSYT